MNNLILLPSDPELLNTLCVAGVHMPDDMTWRLVEPGEEISFTFDGRGRGRQNNSQEIKINQLVVRMDGWQGITESHRSQHLKHLPN